jgi:ABC-2 type transport system ATP-binding protein
MAKSGWNPASQTVSDGERMTATISTHRLTKRYGHTTALDSLDLEIEQGEVFGYLGPNGVGKSTTISLLLGLIHPTSGGARIFDMDVWRDARLVHERLAYVPSEANLWASLTGAEVLRFLGQLHGSVDTAYRDELVRRFELVLDKKIRAYSHGNRQKVLLIAAFASRADVLLLDEPTTGLDPLMEQVFRACVREAGDRGQTVLLSSHILSEVEAVCDRVAMLRAGRIIETGRLEVLRGLAAVRVRAELDGVLPDLTAIPGVSNVVVDDHTIECDVTGVMEPLLRALTDVGVRHMTTREPSLEELFMSRYGEASEAPRSAGSGR